MSNIDRMVNATKGAAVAVGLATALPVFAPVGTITAAGIAISSTLGAILGLLDD